MDTIAVLGLGLLGKGFAENLLAKGKKVRVWNRTASRVEPLVAAGGALQTEVAVDPTTRRATLELVPNDARCARRRAGCSRKQSAERAYNTPCNGARCCSSSGR